MHAQPRLRNTLWRTAIIAAATAAITVSAAADAAVAPQEHEGRAALIARQRQERARTLQPAQPTGI